MRIVLRCERSRPVKISRGVQMLTPLAPRNVHLRASTSQALSNSRRASNVSARPHNGDHAARLRHARRHQLLSPGEPGRRVHLLTHPGSVLQNTQMQHQTARVQIPHSMQKGASIGTCVYQIVWCPAYYVLASHTRRHALHVATRCFG